MNTIWKLFGTKDKEGSILLEVRVKGKAGWLFGLFTSPQNVEKSLSPFVDSANIYCSINHLHNGVVARFPLNKLLSKKEYEVGITDSDITDYQWLFLDFDPIRPQGIPSSRAEHQAAHQKAIDVRHFLDHIGWPEPIYADSGNGAYLLYHINLKHNSTNKELIKNVITELSDRFSDDTVSLDKTTFNPSRIIRLLGTVNRKGIGNEERPHRQSRILEEPVSLRHVSGEQLKALLPKKSRKQEKPQPKSIEEIIEGLGRSVADVEQKNGATWYYLDRCAFDEAHNNTRCAAFVENEDGSRGYKCFHNGCADKNYKAVSTLLSLSHTPPSFLDALNDYLSSYDISHNEINGDVFINGRPIDKFMNAQLEIDAYERGCKRPDVIHNLILLKSKEKRFHPIKEILEALPVYEGGSEIAKLNSVFKTFEPDVKVGDRVIPWFQLYFEYWIVGAIRKIYTGEFNPMLVLIGDKGIGKSSLPFFLAKTFGGYFTQDVAYQLSSKDAAILQSRIFIWEIGELDRITTNHSASDLKNFLTLSQFEQRKPYDRAPTQMHSITSFIGTANNTYIPFLKDRSERRLHIVTLSNPAMDPRAIMLHDGTINPDKIWSEAYQMYLSGAYADRAFQLIDTGKEHPTSINAASTQSMQQYVEQSPALDVIERFFDIDPEQEAWTITSYDLNNILRDHGVGSNRYYTAREAAKVMGELGVKKCKLTSDRVSGYRGIRLKLAHTLPPR